MDRAPGPARESALHWALRLFGLAGPRRPTQVTTPLISLYAVVSVLGLALLLTGHAIGIVLLGAVGGAALGIAWRMWRARH
jgi:hypothetical protein